MSSKQRGAGLIREAIRANARSTDQLTDLLNKKPIECSVERKEIEALIVENDALRVRLENAYLEAL